MASNVQNAAGLSMKTTRRRKLPDWWAIGFHVLCSLILFYLVVPVVLLVPLSFYALKHMDFLREGSLTLWYHKNFLGDEAWRAATRNSFVVALITTSLATPLGTLASFGIVRGRFPGRRALFAFMMSPLIVPSVVIAIALYAVYSRRFLIGNVLALALAHTVIAIPFVVTSVSLALRRFDRNLERSAVSLGAGPIRTMYHVTLPIIRPGVIIGALFAFIVSFDEVVIAIFIAGRTASTLPKKMWEAIRLEIDPTVAAASVFVIVVSVILLGAIHVLNRRSERMRGTGN